MASAYHHDGLAACVGAARDGRLRRGDPLVHRPLRALGQHARLADSRAGPDRRAARRAARSSSSSTAPTGSPGRRASPAGAGSPRSSASPSSPLGGRGHPDPSPHVVARPFDHLSGRMDAAPSTPRARSPRLHPVRARARAGRRRRLAARRARAHAWPSAAYVAARVFVDTWLRQHFKAPLSATWPFTQPGPRPAATPGC